MADHAVSDNPAVQAQLDRLTRLSPGADVLGLDRITRLLNRLDNPHGRLPPVFHVAGTNGKGSTCAFLRAALEADGRTVHVYTSPHLCRFNERIRIAGGLISDAALAEGLSHVLDHADGIGASFFEVTTALAFLMFARTPADACIIEVGLGGRLDATNVVAQPVVCGITQLGLDHQAFLGDTLAQIALEKTGIAKSGVALVTQRYVGNIAASVAQAAAAAGALPVTRGTDWDIAPYQGRAHYRDAAGHIDVPLPRLPGGHQIDNLGLSIAMLKSQSAIPVSEAALKAAPLWAQWPARMQRLEPGPLTGDLPLTREIWLDGGHNPNAAAAIAQHFVGTMPVPQKLTLILGILENKDLRGFLEPLARLTARVISVPVPGHACHDAGAMAAACRHIGVPHDHADTVSAALALAATGADDGPILIAGSLYLAGTVLRDNDQAPV